MQLSDFLPPSDLLRKVEGVEEGLRQRKRLGRLGLTLLALQLALFFSQALRISDLDRDQAVLVGALFLLTLALLSVGWSRAWLKESRQPFRYTFFITNFSPVTDETANQHPHLALRLRHDLGNKLSERIGRLRFLDERELGQLRPGKSHLHISGELLLRDERTEFVARVRVGPTGEPETLAHPAVLDLDPEPRTRPWPRAALTQPPNPSDSYARAFDRVYFSVASQIYSQIRRDIENKISLLPSRRFRAAAYFFEAQDYASSNTLDSYIAARELYERAMCMFDRRLADHPEDLWQRGVNAVIRLWEVFLSLVRRRMAIVIPQLATKDVMAARAEIGYVNMMLYYFQLAWLSGHRVYPVFEARPRARDAVNRLNALPADVPGRTEALFDAHVSLALAHDLLNSSKRAIEQLSVARALQPQRVIDDGPYMYVSGTLRSDLRQKIPRLMRAVEANPRSELAGFGLAYALEMRWRQMGGLDPEAAEPFITEYERVAELNPSNLGAWNNLAYVYWLLGPAYFEKSNDAFERACDYRTIRPETFMAETQYGLARLLIERSSRDPHRDLLEAYRLVNSATNAHITSGTAYGLRGATIDYSYEYIDRSMLDRFEQFRLRAEAKLRQSQAQTETHNAHGIHNAIKAFIANQYGEAYRMYYFRVEAPSDASKAEKAFRDAISADPNLVVARFNLFQILTKSHDSRAEPDLRRLIEEDLGDILRTEGDKELEAIADRAPTWSDGQLEILRSRLGLLRRAQDWASALEEQPNEETVRTPEASDDVSEGVATSDWGPGPSRGYSEGPTDGGRQAVDKRHIDRAQTRLHDLQELWRREASEELRRLLPHEWLWRDSYKRRFLIGSREADPVLEIGPDMSLLSNKKFVRQLRWESQFDDIHALALKALALEFQGDDEAGTRYLLTNFRAHFWMDEWDVLTALNDLRPSPVREGQLSDLRPRLHESRSFDERRQLLVELEKLLHESSSDKDVQRLLSDVAAWMRLPEPRNLKKVSDSLDRLLEERDIMQQQVRDWLDSDPDAASVYSLLQEPLFMPRECEELWIRAAARSSTRSARPSIVYQRIGEGLRAVEQKENALRVYERAIEASSDAKEEPLLDAATIEWELGRWTPALTRLDAAGRDASSLEGVVDRFLPRITVPHIEAYRYLVGWLGVHGFIRQRLDVIQENFLHAILAPITTSHRNQAAEFSAPRPLPLSQIVLEVDPFLFPQGGDTPQLTLMLREYIPSMREAMRRQTGLPPPDVYIRPNGDLAAGNYRILFEDHEVASGVVIAELRFCSDPNLCFDLKLEGTPAEFPGVGSGLWVDPSPEEGDYLTELGVLLDSYRLMVLQVEAALRLKGWLLCDLESTIRILEEWAHNDGVASESVRRVLADAQLVADAVESLRARLRAGKPIHDVESIMASVVGRREKPSPTARPQAMRGRKSIRQERRKPSP